MKAIKDEILFNFNIRRSKQGQLTIYENILKELSDFFPSITPNFLLVNENIVSINGFSDKRIVEVIQQQAKKEELPVKIKDTQKGFSILFSTDTTGFTSSIHTSLLTNHTEKGFVNKFKEFINITKPLYAVCLLYSINIRIHIKHFRWEPRTPASGSLAWLQYFGAEEFLRQGGEDIFDNPYIQAEKIGDGVLIQVGDSPYDAYTPEGEELLVKATKAMPPVVEDE